MVIGMDDTKDRRCWRGAVVAYGRVDVLRKPSRFSLRLRDTTTRSQCNIVEHKHVDF